MAQPALTKLLSELAFSFITERNNKTVAELDPFAKCPIKANLNKTIACGRCGIRLVEGETHPLIDMRTLLSEAHACRVIKNILAQRNIRPVVKEA